VDDVRDVDEADVAAEDDQRQLVGAAGRHQQLCRRVGRLEADPGRARAGHARHPRLDLRRRHPRDPDPGGEQKLSAAQHLAHGRRLEHVHPLDSVSQPVPARGDRDLPRAELLQCQQIRNGQYSLSGFGRIHGHSVMWRERAHSD